jgi:transcription elongation GreA/GreB family factor
MTAQIYVSAAGLAQLQRKLEAKREELNYLRQEKAHAYTATGDTWHDNPYFNRLEQDENRKAVEVAQIAGLISTAQVMSVEERNTARVALGSIVRIARTYERTGEREELIVEVAGYGESDPKKRLIAYNSPLMKDLMGANVRDVVEANSPRGPVVYEILGLYPAWDAITDRNG